MSNFTGRLWGILQWLFDEIRTNIVDKSVFWSLAKIKCLYENPILNMYVGARYIMYYLIIAQVHTF